MKKVTINFDDESMVVVDKAASRSKYINHLVHFDHATSQDQFDCPWAASDGGCKWSGPRKDWYLHVHETHI